MVCNQVLGRKSQNRNIVQIKTFNRHNYTNMYKKSGVAATFSRYVPFNLRMHVKGRKSGGRDQTHTRQNQVKILTREFHIFARRNPDSTINKKNIVLVQDPKLSFI